MNKAIVMTTVQHPTPTVRACSRLDGHHLVVVGDRKTPADWACPNVTYLPVEQHDRVGRRLARLLPLNHYCRKMVGYLHAALCGAAAIVDIDDDVTLKPGWSFPPFDGRYATVTGKSDFINAYSLFTDEKIWPRGLPLRLINARETPDIRDHGKELKVGVWQGLCDGSPDVDAIYRLTCDRPCNFSAREPVTLGENTLSPFNSQNTVFRKELFPLLYLPASVTFRFTDILRGLVAQPIMWLSGYRLGFTGATVIHIRNQHDYFEDFISEIPMYRHCERAVEIVKSAISGDNSLPCNLFNAYTALQNAGIVGQAELASLEGWLNDLQEIKPV